MRGSAPIAAVTSLDRHPNSVGQRFARRRHTTSRVPAWLWPLFGLGVLALGVLTTIQTSGVRSSTSQAKDPQPAAPKASDPSAIEQAPASTSAPSYPAGRWRLAPFHAQHEAILWVSHIVLMHSESRPESSVLRPPGWTPDIKGSRTREEAERLAREVSEDLSEDVARFPVLARTLSDDIVTREFGGILGGMRASQIPPEYKDVLATLQFGETSAPFQTRWGWHVLRRDAPPDPEWVGGERILIRYQGTYESHGPAQTARTREAAQKLVERLINSAYRGSDFGALIGEFSDAADGGRQGDIRVWSTRDPGFSPREVSALAQLGVGEISEPVDSVFGLQIFRRTAVVEEELVSISSLDVPVEDDGFASAQALAREMIRELGRDGASWDEYTHDYCCAVIDTWVAGRNPPELNAALATHVAVGSIFPEPVLSGDSFLVVRRERPSFTAEESKLSFDLPSPEQIDLDAWIIGQGGARQLGDVLRTFIARKLPQLGLPPDVDEKFSTATTHSLEALYKARTLEERLTALEGWREQMRLQLGRDQAHEMELRVAHWFEELVLQ